MSSGPCKDCVSGTLSAEVPTGTETTIHSLPTYVARPEGTPKGLIVIVTDAFGWKFVNNRVLADKYAKKGGHLVYVPDFFNGTGCDPSMMETMDKLMAPGSLVTTVVYKPVYALQVLSQFLPFIFYNRASVMKPRVFDFFRALRTSPDTANIKIGAAGFCFGGLYSIRLAHDTPSSRVHRAGSENGPLQRLIDVSFTAHPSGLAMPDDIDAVTIPLSLAVGDKDFVMPVNQVEQAQTVLDKKKAGDHEVVVYPGAKHGFAIRGDPSDPNAKADGEKAEVQALEWFAKWLA